MNVFDGFGGDVGFVEVWVGLVESYGVVDEVFGCGFEVEFVKYFFYGVGGYVEVWGELLLFVS